MDALAHTVSLLPSPMIRCPIIVRDLQNSRVKKVPLVQILPSKINMMFIKFSILIDLVGRKPCMMNNFIWITFV